MKNIFTIKQLKLKNICFIDKQGCRYQLFCIYFGSGALSGKMLLVSIVENNKIDDYIGQVRLSKG